MAEITGPPGTDDTIAATIEAAMTAGLAHTQYIEQATHTAGDSIGDLAPVTPPPFHDTSILGGQPEGT